MLAWNSLYSKHDPKLVALCAGLAYNCHPYAVAFAAPLALVYLWQWWNGSAGFRNFIGFAVVFLLSILPWLLWTRGYLGISSDLIAQNFVIPGGQASIVDFVWIRLKNLFDLLTPRFFALYPFNAAAIVDNYVTCLPGAVGLFVVGPALFQLTRFPPELLANHRVGHCDSSRFQWSLCANPAWLSANRGNADISRTTLLA